MTPVVSLTGAGLYITLIEFVLRSLGVDFPEGSVGEAVHGIIALLGLVAIVLGQFTRKDLKFGIVRK